VLGTLPRVSPLGVPAPRVDVHGEVLDSYGPEAIELGRRAGLILDPWQCDSLTIDLAVAPDGSWQHFETCEMVPRQNGKGSKAECRALAGLLLFDEKLIMWSAHEYKTAIEMFLRVVQLIRNLIKAGELDEDDIRIIRGNNPGRMIERISTDQRIMFIARSDGSGRGFSGDVNMIDEAFAYTHDMQSALLPTMSARDNPQIMYLSSPPLTGDTGEVLYDLRRRALAGGDDSLSFRDWGLAGDLDDLTGIDLDDVALWHQANPSSIGPRRRPTVAFMTKERRAMSPEKFARERLGIWPREITQGSGVIDPEVWAALMIEPERPMDIALSVVISHNRRYAVIAATGKLHDGRIVTTVIDHKQGTAWLVPRLIELKARWNPAVIAIQDKGPTGSLLAGLSDAEREQLPVCKDHHEFDHPINRLHRGEVVIPWADEVADAYGLWVDAVVQGRLFHFGDVPLTTSINETGTRALSNATAWDYKGDNAATVIASTLSYWAYVSMAERLSNEYDVLASIF
jgi:hypothetical protein